MDYNAYHRALHQGFSESEATKIGEEAWEDSLIERRRHSPEPEPPGPPAEYYLEQQVNELQRHIKSLIDLINDRGQLMAECSVFEADKVWRAWIARSRELVAEVKP